MISVLYQEKSAVTNDCNHPAEDCVSFISTDSSTKMMSTQIDGQNSLR